MSFTGFFLQPSRNETAKKAESLISYIYIQYIYVCMYTVRVSSLNIAIFSFVSNNGRKVNISVA